MPLLYTCPQCGAEHSTTDAMAGRRIRCPECDAVGVVPEAETASDSTRDQSMMEDEAPADVALLEAAGLTPLTSAGDGRWSGSGAAAIAEPPAPPVGGDGGDDDDDGDDGPAFQMPPKKKLPEGEMDMTPMVDVTFLLLIFFMVTAAFTMQKSLNIPKPEQTDEPSSNTVEQMEESPDTVIIRVDEFNTFTVMTNDWEKEAPGEIDLLARLRDARKGSPGLDPPNTLLVKAHSESFHERVVMALDAGTATGFEQIQLMTADDE